MTAHPTLRVFTAFSGYDSQLLALERLHRAFPTFRYECVGWCDIDRTAIKVHNALFPALAGKNYGDISTIDWDSVPDFDLFTYSSPCQDFSLMGYMRGGTEGSGTRSSLLWECRRTIEAKHPRYLLLENVKGLVSGSFCSLFLQWQRTLRGLGYVNYAKVLNAADYGVPQCRERLFCISFADDRPFHFPAPLPATRRLADLLDPLDVIPPQYWKDNEMARLRPWPRRQETDGTRIVYYGKIDQEVYNVTSNIIAITGAAPTVLTGNMWRILDPRGDTPRIRSLTPRECFRLMDVDEHDIDTIAAVSSQVGQYALAGNSIVVNVLFHIFRKMFIDGSNEEPQQTLW